MHILLTGATGLLGQGVLGACRAAPQATHITLLSRRQTGLQQAGLDELVLPDFAQAASLQMQLAGIDACFYCAGAPPIGTAEDEYRHVTLGLTLAVARAYAAANPHGRFFYISGAHSNPGSRVMPLRVKGETESALQALPITTVMLRPGGILPEAGTRSPHGVLRFFHALSKPLQGVIVKGAPGVATTNGTIGRAMLQLASLSTPPAVVENREINRLGALG
ncbi:NAD-dependent epimerase/dehydratase family protein [Stenotrophomonas tumulicola]|uniref:Oxidoreductase n=1 Tax=Stenotrophomonas tumulicola TaxID=1685415 RepID=A0A7W3FJJ4_9GAMM|nr:NAD-dependent epimerase/dehydratase family protein [Stenotrophomonas tumulicola]MBA8680747.1 oxidoreductase [Stenotrophomonas tumulicola]